MNIKLNIDGVDYTCTPNPPPPPPFGLFLLPAGVVPAITKLDALAWVGTKDAATAGTATFQTEYPVTVGGKQARSFSTKYALGAGVRFSCIYEPLNDPTSTHFIYAGYLWIDDPSQVGQMELDNNQVTADGRTYIFGVQANANDGCWDITTMDPNARWLPTPAKANLHSWPAKTWLRFEIMSHRDNAGNITYDAIYLNGTTVQIGKTLPSAQKLGWNIGRLLVNWQLGGLSGKSGAIQAYGSEIEVAKWS